MFSFLLFFSLSFFLARAIRLVGGQSLLEGRVEIFFNNEWGTVCDDFWDQTDAEVVCRQLGFPVERAIGNAHFGQGSGNIWLNNVACTGSEQYLSQCSHVGWGNEDCSHGEDAGVMCGERVILVLSLDVRPVRHYVLKFTHLQFLS